jgi:hypothetical protein
MEELFDVNVSKKHLKKNNQSELQNKDNKKQEEHTRTNELIPNSQLNKEPFACLNSSSISYISNRICLKDLSGLFRPSVTSNDNRMGYSFKDNVSFSNTIQRGEYEVVKINSKSEIDLSKLNYSCSYVTRQNHSSENKVTLFFHLINSENIILRTRSCQFDQFK